MPSLLKSKFVIGTWAFAALTVGLAATALGQMRFDQNIQVRPDAMIGVATQDAPADKPEGAVVTSVEAGMPAAKAGVREGDVIVEFDGERVRSSTQLTRLVRETAAGRPVKMAVMRDGKRVDLTVTPTTFATSWPEFREGPRTPAFRPWLYQGPARPDYNWYINPRTPFLPSMPRLGISVQPLTSQLAEYFGTKDGVLVAAVDDGSAAARAGLKAGDIITAIDGRRVTDTRDVQQSIAGKRSGDEIKVDVVRDRKARTITVTL